MVTSTPQLFAIRTTSTFHLDYNNIIQKLCLLCVLYSAIAPHSRKQFVSYNCHESDMKNIICGVPQGSILGPLLFIIYVNDIINTSDVLEFILFADDTTILFSHKDIENQISLINTELNEVSNWFKANKLSVNASKTNYMILGTPHMTSVKQTEVILDNTILDRVQCTKFLGVLIDECLTLSSPWDFLNCSEICRCPDIIGYRN